MSGDTEVLDVKIMDRSFKVSCPPGERESLLQAVDLVDSRMREIKAAGKLTGGERVAVMAALNIAHELLSTRLPGGCDIGEVKRRIGGMKASIEQAMAEQEDLF